MIQVSVEHLSLQTSGIDLNDGQSQFAAEPTYSILCFPIPIVKLVADFDCQQKPQTEETETPLPCGVHPVSTCTLR